MVFASAFLDVNKLLDVWLRQHRDADVVAEQLGVLGVGEARLAAIVAERRTYRVNQVISRLGKRLAREVEGSLGELSDKTQPSAPVAAVCAER